MAVAPVPALRPLGIGDLLDEVFTVYRRGFRTFLGIAALLQVPTAIVALPLYAASARFTGGLSRGGDWARAIETFGSDAAPWSLLLALMSAIGAVLMLGALCHATSAIYLGQRTSLASAYRQALRRFWRMVHLALMIGLACIGLLVLSMVFAFLPALLCGSMPAALLLVVYLTTSWSLAVPALLLEDRADAVRALRRSRELVRLAWWRTFATLALLVVLSWVVSGLATGLVEAATALLQAVTGYGGARPEWLAVLAGLLQNLLAILYAPLVAIGITLYYYDRRVRTEGFDLLVQARALAAMCAEPGAS